MAGLSRTALIGLVAGFLFIIGDVVLTMVQLPAAQAEVVAGERVLNHLSILFVAVTLHVAFAVFSHPFGPDLPRQ